MAIAVLEANGFAVVGRFACSVGCQRNSSACGIFRMAQVFPHLGRDRVQLVPTVAQHVGPQWVDLRLLGLQVQRPSGGTGAFNGGLQPLAAFGQLQLTLFAIVNVLHGAIQAHAAAIRHFGSANGAHPAQLTFGSLNLQLGVVALAELCGALHQAGQGLARGGFGVTGQRRLQRGFPARREAVDFSRHCRPLQLLGVPVQFPGADAGRLVGQLQRPAGALQGLLRFFARRDVGADGHITFDLTVGAHKRSHQAVDPIQASTLGTVAHLAMPGLARTDGRPHGAPEIGRVVARVDDLVPRAHQFFDAVAADVDKRLVGIGDDAARIGLGHDGVRLDGVHQRLGFAQGVHHFGASLHLHGDVALDRDEARDLSVCIAGRLYVDAGPVFLTGFAAVQHLCLVRMCAFLGGRQLVVGDPVGFFKVQQFVGTPPQHLFG